MHPVTYLNKILLASQQGSLQLWNIRTRWVGFFANSSHSAVYPLVSLGVRVCVYVCVRAWVGVCACVRACVCVCLT